MKIDGIEVEEKGVYCTFGDHDVAMGHFKMPRGCAAMPDVTEQDLCLQHIVKAEPIGSMELDLIYNVDLYLLLNRPKPRYKTA